MVALPGLVGALERNMKWLDHRVAHWFNNRSEQTPYDFDSPRPFCLDRTIVIPYPPHTSLMHHCGKQPAYVPWAERRINVSFYGTIRARTGIADSSGGVRSALMQLAQGGYDTHANQAARQGRALTQLAGALAAFAAGLERLPNRPAVTLLAVSEFGRRLRENGSRGTDHGSASVALLFGDQLPDRLIGRYPSLSNLDERGDLIATLSPPELYRQVLRLARV